jgi:hypothetical protein
LRETKKDYQGFLNPGDTWCPKITLSNESSDRALRILDTLATVATAQEHRLFMKKNTCYWQIQAEVFEFKIYEMKGKKNHEPTAKELKEQAQRDEWRTRHPDWYTTDRKIYRGWDYFPSGRLAFHIKDTTYYRREYPAIEKR